MSNLGSMYSWSKQRLGEYPDAHGNERFYFLSVSVEPDPDTTAEFTLDHAEEWCVVVGREAPPIPNESNTQIVRIDTNHGTPHVDKLWLKPDHENRKRWLGDEFTVHDAKDHLKRNWQEYVRRYIVYREGGTVE